MYDVLEKSIEQLQADMTAGVTTAEEITMAYLLRIARLDQDGPKVNSVLEINPDALFCARALDRERRISGPRGPLHGIPVLLKDNISTGDKLHTSAGAEALADNFALADAPVVRQLRRAGAIILGKTNLSELARYMNTEIPNGYSARGGQTLNPHGEDLDPLGSSTGSAVAAAMSFAAAAVGTETCGSIISPSSANSIVGLKPTVGAVSRSGIIPINSQDTAGPMARTVRDAAILLGALTGPDEDDPATLSTGQVVFTDYLPFLDEDALRGVRVGVGIPEAGWLSQPQIDRYREALSFLEKAGAELVYGCDIPSVEQAECCLTEPVMAYEFKRYMDAYLAKYCSLPGVRTLHDLVVYNRAHEQTAARYGQDILEDCDEHTSGRLTEPVYLLEKARVLQACGPDGIDRVMRENGVDVLVCPAVNAEAATCGYPLVTVPAGIASDGRPIGLTMIAGPFSEGRLLGWAYAFEQASQLRVVPSIARQ